MLLNVQEVSNILRLSPATLFKYRKQGKGPTYIRMGQKVLYDEKDINNYIEQSKHLNNIEKDKGL